MWQLYGSPTTMTTQTPDCFFHFQMRAGTIQGEQFAAFGYSLVQKVLMDFVKEQCVRYDPSFRLEVESYLLDDSLHVAVLERYSPEKGLHSNNSKQKITVNLPDAIAVLDGKLTDWACGFRWRTDGCFDCIGVPVGDKTYVDAFMAKKVAEWVKLIDQVAVLDARPIRYKILRDFASACRATYTSRNLFVDQSTDWAAAFDTRIRFAMESVAGWNLSNDQLAQAQLSRPCAGSGVRNIAVGLCAANLARLSSTRNCLQPLVSEAVLAATQPFIDGHTNSALKRFNAAVLPERRIKLEVVQRNNLSQRGLMHLLDERVWHRLHAAASPRRRAQLLSMRCPWALSWLDVLPNKELGESFTNVQWSLLWCRMLGEPILLHDAVCDECGEPATCTATAALCASTAAAGSPGTTASRLSSAGYCGRPGRSLTPSTCTCSAATASSGPRTSWCAAG